MANMLSRTSLPITKEEEEHVSMCAYLPIRTEKTNKIKKKTEIDEVLVKLKNIVLQLYSFLTTISKMKWLYKMDWYLKGTE